MLHPTGGKMEGRGSWETRPGRKHRGSGRPRPKCGLKQGRPLHAHRITHFSQFQDAHPSWPDDGWDSMPWAAVRANRTENSTSVSQSPQPPPQHRHQLQSRLLENAARMRRCSKKRRSHVVALGASQALRGIQSTPPRPAPAGQQGRQGCCFYPVFPSQWGLHKMRKGVKGFSQPWSSPQTGVSPP